MTQVAQPYNARKAPPDYSNGFLNVEHQAIQRAIAALVQNDVRQAVVDPTDGATAIQDAINSLSVGQVSLRPGTFNYSAEIVHKQSVSLRGSGRGVTILNYTGAGQGMSLTATNSLYWGNRLRDFTLTTPIVAPPYAGTYGLVVDSVVVSSHKRIEITGWGTAGLLLKGAVLPCLSHTFEEVDIHENINGVRTSGGSLLVNHINFGQGCRIRASQQWNVFNDLIVAGWKFVGVDLEAGVLGAIWMGQFKGLTIDTCYFEQTSSGSAVVLADTLAGYGLQMFGNFVSGSAAGTAVKLGVGGGSVAGSVVNNVFESWSVGINRTGLLAGGDYTTGNKYNAVTTPTFP